MPISASWHTELVAADLDPFEIPERIEDVGVPIRLAGEGHDAELRRELLATVEREVQLADAGHTCQIKGTHGASCHACPLYRDDDPLCAIGRTQERLCTELRVIHVGGRRK